MQEKIILLHQWLLPNGEVQAKDPKSIHLMGDSHSIGKRRISDRIQFSMVSKLKIENEHFSALYSIALDLLHHQSLEDVLKTIVYRASELLDSPICFLDLMDGDEFVVQAATPMVDSIIGMRVRVEKAVLTELAIRTRTPQFVKNYGKRKDRLKGYDHLG